MLLDPTGMSYRIETTTRPGDATEIARRTDAEVLVVVGGDGTTNEVANGIVGTELFAPVDTVTPAHVCASIAFTALATWFVPTTGSVASDPVVPPNPVNV